MVTKPQRNANTNTSPASAAGSDDSQADDGKAVATIKQSTSPGRSLNAKPSLLASVRMADSQRVADKLTIVGAVKQRLAEAADLFRSGDDKAQEANAIADKAAVKLYQAKAGDLLTGEEINSLLGDVFGFKRKGGTGSVPAGDPTASKTPFGQGEAIRKRVVRAIQADDYASGRDATTFFEGLPSNDFDDDEGNTVMGVKTILNAVNDGSMSIWTAYDKFAALRRAVTVRVNVAFDAKRIGAIFDALAENGGKSAAAIFASSPELVAAYAALMEALQVVDELAAGIASEQPGTILADADEAHELAEELAAA